MEETAPIRDVGSKQAGVLAHKMASCRELVNIREKERYGRNVKGRERDVLYSRLVNAIVGQLRCGVVDSLSCVMDPGEMLRRVEQESDATVDNNRLCVRLPSLREPDVEVETCPCRYGI